MTHKSTQPWSLHSCHGDHSLWSCVAQVTIFTMWTLPHISYLSVCLSLLIFSTPAMRTSSPLPWSSSTMRLLVLQGHPTAYTNYLLLTAAVTRTNILLEQLIFYTTISKDCYFLFWPTRWRQTTLHCFWLIDLCIRILLVLILLQLPCPPAPVVLLLTPAPSLVVPWCNIGAGTNYRNHDPHNLGNNSLFNTLLVSCYFTYAITNN